MNERLKYLEELVEKQSAEIERLKSDLQASLATSFDEKQREMLERFRQIIMQSPNMIVIINKEGYIEYFNDRLTEILGYRQEDIIGTLHIFTAPDESGQENYRRIYEGLTTRGQFSGDVELATKDGTRIWVRASIAPVLKNNVPDFYVGVMYDISHEISLKKQYDESKSMMDTIMDNATIAITLMDYDGYFKYFNKQAEKNLLFSEEDLKTKPINELFPDQGQATLNSIRKIFSEKKPQHLEVTYVINDKENVFDMTRLPLFNKEGKVLNILSIARDITEEKNALKRSEIYDTIDSLQSIGETFLESLSILFDNLFKFYWIDAGGLYLVNYEKKTLDLEYHRGLSKDFIKRTSSYPLTSENARVAFAKIPRYVTMDHYLSGSKENVEVEKITFIASLPLVYRDKVLGLLNLASRQVTDIDEKDKHALEIVALKVANLIELIETREKLDKSNTELSKKLKELSINQQMLIQKSKLESLGELSAGLAHEINQPLSIMSLAMENIHYKLGTKAATPEYLQKKFDTISLNINKIRNLIDHMRIFSRDQGTIMFEQVNVNRVITNALSMIGSQLRNRHISLILGLSEDPGHTLGNPSRFEQVILNLISNSRDALEEKAQRSFQQDLKMEISIRTWLEDNQILVSVRDNGSGIKPEDLEHIFNPFYTTKSEGHGTGLGLPIVYGIIREMKGEIIAKSEFGEYTEITIKLPWFKNNG